MYIVHMYVRPSSQMQGTNIGMTLLPHPPSPLPPNSAYILNLIFSDKYYGRKKKRKYNSEKGAWFPFMFEK